MALHKRKGTIWALDIGEKKKFESAISVGGTARCTMIQQGYILTIRVCLGNLRKK